MAAPLKPLTAIARQRVGVADLRSALAALWEQIEGSDARPLSRALTSNLVCVTPAAAEDRLRRALDRVILRHPCRAFLIVVQEGGAGGARGDTRDTRDARGDGGDDRIGAGAALSAEIGALVRTEGAGRQTVLEEITLRAGRADFAQIAGMVRPLVVRDLPVHLFWAMPLPDQLGALTTMASLADQTVVDSCAFADPDRDLARLSQLAELNAVDLAHFRTRPWRRALAEAFEHFAWDRERPTRVTIAHGASCGARAAALGLARWLRERLNAQVALATPGVPAAGTAAGAEPAAGTAAAAVAEPAAAGNTPATGATGAAAGDRSPDAEPASLSLEHGEAQVAVERRADAPKLRVRVTLGDHCLLPWEVPASRGEVGDLLAAALDAL